MQSCPFCRSAAIEPLELEPGERYAYGCQDCGMVGPPAETEDEAALEWENRDG